MAEDAAVRSARLGDMADALASCDDRVILAMNDMELRVRIDAAVAAGLAEHSRQLLGAQFPLRRQRWVRDRADDMVGVTYQGDGRRLQ